MLLDEYLKAVDNLTINTTSQINENVIKTQQKLAAEIEEKDQEISELQNRIKALEEDRVREITNFEARVKKVDEDTPRLLKIVEHLEAEIENLKNKSVSN